MLVCVFAHAYLLTRPSIHVCIWGPAGGRTQFGSWTVKMVLHSSCKAPWFMHSSQLIPHWIHHSETLLQLENCTAALSHLSRSSKSQLIYRTRLENFFFSFLNNHAKWIAILLATSVGKMQLPRASGLSQCLSGIFYWLHNPQMNHLRKCLWPRNWATGFAGNKKISKNGWLLSV